MSTNACEALATIDVTDYSGKVTGAGEHNFDAI
jgi:hypothetical protein